MKPEDRRLTPPPSSPPGPFSRDVTLSPPSTSHPRQPLPRSSPAPRTTPEPVPPRQPPTQGAVPAQRTANPHPPATSTTTPFRVISAALNNTGTSGSAQSQPSASTSQLPTSSTLTSGVPTPLQPSSTSAKKGPVTNATKKKKKAIRRGW